MKANTQALTAEKEALEWAVDYVRKCADDLKPGRQGMEDAVIGSLLLYDSPHHRAQAEKEIMRDLLIAWLGHKEASQQIREFAAALMERGDSLPAGLRNFIVEFLRSPEKPNLRKSQLVEILTRPPTSLDETGALARLEEIREVNIRKPGRGSGDLLSRDTLIWTIMQHIVRTWKIPATRNDATKDKGKRACAASIVREAVKKGAAVHLSEAAVAKVWNKMRLGGEEARALFPDLLETIPTD